MDYAQLNRDGFIHLPGVFSATELAPAVEAAHRIHVLSQGWDFQKCYGNIRFFNAFLGDNMCLMCALP